MNCQQADELMFSYCDSNLSSSLVSEFESHIANCRPCQTKIALTRMETDILQTGLTTPILAHDFTAMVMSAIGGSSLPGSIESAAARVRRPWYTRTPLWLAATAAAFLLLLYTVSPGLFTPSTKIAEEKDSKIKVAEKLGAASNITSNNAKLKEDVKGTANSENSIDEHSNDSGLPAGAAYDGAPLRTMNGTTPADNGILMKRDSCPDRDRSDATMLKAPSEYSGNTLNSPKISNMPSTYSMVSSNSQDNGWSYVYEGNGKQITVSLSTDKLESSSIMQKSVTAESSADTAAGAPAANYSGVGESGIINSVQRSVSIDDVSYQLTVSGELPVEQLNAVSSTLTIGK